MTSEDKEQTWARLLISVISSEARDLVSSELGFRFLGLTSK
jgi:hypothetical protein